VWTVANPNETYADVPIDRNNKIHLPDDAKPVHW